MHSVTYSENNIPETCQGTKLSKMRDPEKCLMINGTVDTWKIMPIWLWHNGSEIKNQRSIFMWPDYVSIDTIHT